MVSRMTSVPGLVLLVERHGPAHHRTPGRSGFSTPTLRAGQYGTRNLGAVREGRFQAIAISKSGSTGAAGRYRQQRRGQK